MAHTMEQEPESSLHLEAGRIERVEHFRLRKVITVEDLLVALGYGVKDLAPTPPTPRRGGRSRVLGRSWGFRIATGRHPTRACRRFLRWMS